MEAGIERYSRQLLVPELGVDGQKKISATSVLVVGVGGLGSPVALYLAGGGIGRIGLVDYDDVALCNLHRQVVHAEADIGHNKADSGAEAIRRLNSTVTCEKHKVLLDRSNAMDIIRGYDIVVDCSDNVATRYLLNDACVLGGKVLVSGSALRMEGQLTVYNNGADCPCYRCILPRPPATVTNCSDGGVLGVVPGIIGSMQALEVLKIAAGMECSVSKRLMLFDAVTCSFRFIKLPPRRKDCAVCGDTPTVTELVDYVAFCGSAPNDSAAPVPIHLADEHRISCEEFSVARAQPHVLVDCRRALEYRICALEGSWNVPLSDLKDRLDDVVGRVKECEGIQNVFVICRRGRDSQTAVQMLVEALEGVDVRHVDGGLEAWAALHPSFKMY